MPISTSIKPAHKAVVAYYQTLEQYSGQRVEHELAVRSAFQNLLAETAKPHGWMLIPELVKKVSGHSLRPDGTLRDTNSLPRGYWEAKDSSDDLDAEIKKKTKLGYPLTNTIFEDTRKAVLFQNKREAMRVQLADRQQLCNLLNLFYSHPVPGQHGQTQRHQIRPQPARRPRIHRPPGRPGHPRQRRNRGDREGPAGAVHRLTQRVSAAGRSRHSRP